MYCFFFLFFFFFQAEDGIRDADVTGVQTCALPIAGPERRSIKMKGRVAVLRAYGGEFDLREYPVPEVEPGAILVKLTRAGVCGSDLHIWRGEMKETYGASPQDL